jgi:hypothetical protein
MSDVDVRNITAIAESAKRERARLDELIITVRGLQATVAQQASEISSLRIQLAISMAKINGNGRTT